MEDTLIKYTDVTICQQELSVLENVDLDLKKGELVYQKPTTQEIRAYCLEQLSLLWDEVKRFDNPHSYYVDLSQKLWEIKYALLKNNAGGNDEAQR